ncbi:hypothetical protein [Ruminococcus sp.]|uniref:hypothetical protein n=1 Tax=Ruminococcus sp. TaxID=41978 RepID=UPI00260FC85D|nr:hypothetical protein [Ruminococcus sp.]MDD6988752.1 hypothetical protein [Ruminococcus sp.]
MTDNEIIKSMQCVIGNDANCSECTYQKVLPFPSCRMMCAKNALNLINRQQAEIERYLHSIKLLENDVATAKSEAIKWFAEKLKMECYATYDEVLPSLFADIIDKLVKEMAECDGK